MLVIGSLNSSEEVVYTLLKRRDRERLLEEASHQLKMGGTMLAINTAERREKELEDMVWMMTTLQERFSIPLCLDSSNPFLFKEVLPYYNSSYGPPLINSMTGEEEKLEVLLPLLKEYGCPVVVLLMNEETLKGGVEERVEVGREILERTREYSIPDSSLYLDPLLFPLGVSHGHGLLFLEILKKLQREFPSAKSICGLDNISYGLPERELLDVVFLITLYHANISAVMMTLKGVHGSMMTTLKALYGEDPHSLNYIKAYREGTLSIFTKEALL